MGTKNEPGKFDCYAAADGNEPLFVLKSTDESAPTVVRIWAELYRERKMKAGKWNERATRRYIEALEVANQMAAWHAKNGTDSPAPIPYRMSPPEAVALGEMQPAADGGMYFGAGSAAARMLDGLASRGIQSEPPPVDGEFDGEELDGQDRAVLGMRCPPGMVEPRGMQSEPPDGE